MLNTSVIVSHLEKCRVKVKEAIHTETNVLKQLRLHLQPEGLAKKEAVVVVWKEKRIKNKFFISIEEKGDFTSDEHEKIDAIIIDAINCTPENKIPFLFNNPFMISKTSNVPLFLELEDSLCLENELPAFLRNFEDDINTNQICFFNMLIPKNNRDQSILDLFSCADVVYDILETEKHYIVSFYRFNMSMVKEKLGLEEMQRLLEERGLPVELSNCHSHPLN